MHYRLHELLSLIKISVGQLTGNERLERIARAERARALAQRSAESATRPATTRFRVGVGQQTHHEQLAAQVETARRRPEPG